VRDVRVRQISQHPQRVELRVGDEVRHGTDPTTGNRFSSEQGLSLLCGSQLEASLQQTMEGHAVGNPICVVGIGRIRRELRKIEDPAQLGEEVVVPAVTMRSPSAVAKTS
jgi:hypothetical protein